MRQGATGKRGAAILAVGLLAAALLYGDSMITPAISVLIAVEGLIVAAPALHDLVFPVTLGILTGFVLGPTPRAPRAWADCLARI